MTWHATGKCTEPGKMKHPVDDRAWKKFDTRYPDFAAKQRNVRLGLAADGFNLFRNLSQSYSMWPVILKTYNLPPWLCMKESYLMLTLLIPCPESPGKDIDVYFRPLIDDLKNLWALKGVETINVEWARFLKKPHKWRRSRDFNGETKDGDPPRKFDLAQIQTKLDRLPTLEKGKHSSYGGVKIKRNVLVELNWTKISIFYELESNFKHKVTDNDSNITGLKSHDCHIMMQRLLPYGLQQYLPSSVATPIIELCLFFKQICSRTLIEADMVKAQSQDVTMKFNSPDRNVDYSPPTCQFQVFQSICKSIGKRSVIRLDHQELNKVIWYVLHNSPEIDTYRAKFKSEFPNQDMKEEFPDWFGS
ncbi:hypothetical protein Tco_0722405 [Tanacetum coccineum]